MTDKELKRLERIEYIMWRVRSAILDVLKYRTPLHWQYKLVRMIERRTLAEQRKRVEMLPDEYLYSESDLGREIWIAESDTKDAILRMSWL